MVTPVYPGTPVCKVTAAGSFAKGGTLNENESAQLEVNYDCTGVRTLTQISCMCGVTNKP